MANGHGCVGLQQQARHRLADDIRTTDDDCIEARQIGAKMILDHQHAAGRRAWHERVGGISRSQFADVDEMEAIDVLGRRYRLRDRLFVEVTRQRELHENAVNFLVIIELINQLEHVFLRRVRVERMLHRVKAAAFCAFAFVAHIDLACRVLPDDHNCESRLQAMLRE